MDQNKTPTTVVDWARQQIRLRLDEWDEFEVLAHNTPDTYPETTERCRILDERTCYSFQEIMKIALQAQIELEDETDGYNAAELVLGFIHYLTGDPTDIEIVKRS